MDSGFVRGVRLMSRGIRTGNAGVAGLGTALAAWALVTRTADPAREPVQVLEVRPGDEIRVVVIRAPHRTR